MSEHLSLADREALIATVTVTCRYFCEFATDGDLFALHSILSQQAAQLAHRLAAIGDGMLGPSAPSQVYAQESLNQRLMAANHAMQRMENG
jgi:hypothetical protein